MIDVELSSILFLYMAVFLGSVFGLWVLISRRRRSDRWRRTHQERFRMRCSMCHHTYIDSRLSEFSQCPECGHQNDRP